MKCSAMLSNCTTLFQKAVPLLFFAIYFVFIGRL